MQSIAKLPDRPILAWPRSSHNRENGLQILNPALLEIRRGHSNVSKWIAKENIFIADSLGHRKARLAMLDQYFRTRFNDSKPADGSWFQVPSSTSSHAAKEAGVISVAMSTSMALATISKARARARRESTHYTI